LDFLFGENVIVACCKMKKILLFTFFICTSSALANDAKFFNDVLKVENKSIEKFKDEAGVIKNYHKNSQDYMGAADAVRGGAEYNKYTGAMPDLLKGVGSIEQANKKPMQYDLMIFISSSMPKTSLRNLAIEAKRVGAILVLRGLVNDSFKQSVQYIKSLNDEGVGAIIDPHSYKLFDIKHVPTFVAISEDNTCHPKICTPTHDKISGNISLKYALEQLKKDGVYSKNTAQKYLKRYDG